MHLLLVVMMLALGDPVDPPTYRRDIEPILKANCTICHNEKDRAEAKVSGGLALDDLPKLRNGRDGRLVRPGNSKESLLLEALLRKDESKRMPKDGEPLSPAEIDLIRKWIDSGAREGAPVAEQQSTSGSSRFAKRLRNQVIVLPITPTPPPGVLKPGTEGPLTLQINSPRLEPVDALALAPDGVWLLVGRFGRVFLWNLKQARLTGELAVSGYVHDLKFSQDGKTLAVAGGMPSEIGWVRLYSCETWNLDRVLSGHRDVVTGVAFHPSAPLLASAGMDKIVRIWDLHSGEPRRDFKGHSEGVTSVAFAPDGRFLYSASKDRTLRKIAVDTGKAELTFTGQRDEVLTVAVAPESGQVLSGGLDRGLSFWNPETAERIRLQPAAGAVLDLALSKQLAVTVGPDSAVRLWSLPGGSAVRSLPTPGPQSAVAVASDVGRVVAGGNDGLVRLWDSRSGRPLATFFAGNRSEWLLCTAEGYFAASSGLKLTGRQGAHELSAEDLFPKLNQPALVVQSLAGQKVPPLQPRTKDKVD